MADTIRILGLMFNAQHGVQEEEKTLTQPFEVDVEISRDLLKATFNDKLEETVDYSQVVEIVKSVMYGEQCCLIERLAGRIIERLSSTLEDECEVTVRVRKPRAPIDIPFKTVEVELRRKISK